MFDGRIAVLQKLLRFFKKRKMSVEIKNLGNYSVLTTSGQTRVYSLHTDDPKEIPYGWALVTVDQDTPDECVLWDIHVRTQYRRMGFGKKLMAVLQGNYKRIFTQYERGLINSPGCRLCMSCGFKMKQQMFKNVPPAMEWVK